MTKQSNNTEGILLKRYIRPRLLEALEDTPAVLIHGARQCGKTTLAQEIAREKGYQYFSLDNVGILAAAREDPVGFVEDLPEKAVLDEVQKAPEIFSALKQTIDRDRQPGRYILTGSANVLFVPKLSDSLAGRMEIIPLFPFAQCEIEQTNPSFLESLLSGKIKMRQWKKERGELFERVLKGGYPPPLGRPARARHRWYREYVNTLIQRDIRDLGRLSSFDVIPKLLEHMAGQTSRLRNFSDLSAPFEVSRQTIRHYVNLLERIFLVEMLQPWHSNQLKRLIRTPKLHLTDTGLAGALLNMPEDDLLQKRTFSGQLLETFVYNELKRQLSWNSDSFHDLFHYRDKDKYEVDLVVRKGAKIAGVEVKAAATITSKDFRGMKRLRKETGSSFICGVVLYDGEKSLPFGERLYAVPIKAIWSDR